VFYVLWKARLSGDYSGLSASLFSVVKGPAYFHLWYLYALVGIYLFIPFMSKIYRHSTEAEKITYLALWFVVACIIPLVSYFYPAGGDLATVYGLSSFVGLSGFVFLGAYVFDRIKTQAKPSLVADAAGDLLVIAARRHAQSAVFFLSFAICCGRRGFRVSAVY
jgi:surface polysaccharide O-acyltransferase-like enzyme